MLKEVLVEFFERDLRKLKEEISLYADENALWITRGDISNSAGNLCLHLAGNLNHFVGAVLGHTGYVRDRDREFAEKGVPRAALLAQLETTIEVVTSTLNNMSDEDLESDFPLEKHGKIVKTDHMLVHLLAHLNYHLGQVNYHRRLVQQMAFQK